MKPLWDVTYLGELFSFRGVVTNNKMEANYNIFVNIWNYCTDIINISKIHTHKNWSAEF